MRKIFFIAAVAVALSGCATSPDQFQQSVNNIVTDTKASTTAAVSIGTDILSAILALYQPFVNAVKVVTGS